MSTNTKYLPLLDALIAANKADQAYRAEYTAAQLHGEPERLNAAAKAGNRISDVKASLLEFFEALSWLKTHPTQEITTMTQSNIITMTEATAVQKLAENGQILRRAPHLPANKTGLSDQIAAHLVANITGYGGTNVAALRAAAEGADSVVAGVAAIEALKAA